MDDKMIFYHFVVHYFVFSIAASKPLPGSKLWYELCTFCAERDWFECETLKFVTSPQHNDCELQPGSIIFMKLPQIFAALSEKDRMYHDEAGALQAVILL